MKAYYSLLISLFLLASSLASATMPQTEIIDLDRSEMQRLGFDASVGVRNGTVFLTFDYPASVDDRYFPIGSEVISKTPTDKVISRSSTWVSDKGRHINVQYPLGEVDVEVSVSYTCESETRPTCGPGRRYGIKSVSKLIRKSDME